MELIRIGRYIVNMENIVAIEKTEDQKLNFIGENKTISTYIEPAETLDKIFDALATYFDALPIDNGVQNDAPSTSTL